MNWQTDQDCEMIGGKGQRSNEEAMYNTYSPGIKLIPRVSWRKNRGLKQPEESGAGQTRTCRAASLERRRRRDSSLLRCLEGSWQEEGGVCLMNSLRRYPVMGE